MPLKKFKNVPCEPVGLAPTLMAWYAANRRDLPWRPPMGKTSPVDPYAVLVSEFMLQQTQVSTVKDYFLRFMDAFPTLATLAAASEQEVLRRWQGLGYYSRARNLHATARRIEADFEGRIPKAIDQLTALPGIGRYTAGAIASIAFDQPAPILDGNVARVLCRVEKIKTDPRGPKTARLLWTLAEKILPASQCGEFNSALMELGATICTPRDPKCLICPIRQLCKAAAAGAQNEIPLARKSRPTPLVRRWTICVRHRSRWLIERRPNTGRWAGLWQFPTIEADGAPPSPDAFSKTLGFRIADLHPLGEVSHTLTHRRYVFHAFAATALSASKRSNQKWIRLGELAEYPISVPQQKIAAMVLEFSERNHAAR